MQIHELNRPRRTDEGVLGAIGTALGQAVSPGVGTTQDFRASSAGILDPKKKLDAVMKNSQMAGLATKYADEWLTDKRSQVSAAPAAAPAPAPAAAPVPAAKLTAQQQADKKAELLGKRGAGKTTATQTGSGFKDYVGGSQNKLITNPDGSTSMKKLQRESTYYNFDYILESIININEKAAVATPPVTKPAPAPATVNAQGFNYNNVMKMPGMEKYATPPAGQPKPGQPPAGQPKPGQPPVAQPAAGAQSPTGQAPTPGQPPAAGAQSPGQPTPGQPPAAGAGAMGAMAGQLAKGGAAEPNTMANAPVSKTNTAKPGNPNAGQAQPAAGAQPPANPEYIKNFLEFANEKVAMRDSATYKMLGLTDAEGSELGPQLDAAKQAVEDAQGNPANTKTAVKNYILTALAALQLVTSQNSVKAASPEAPAYGQQPAAGAAGAAAGTAPATGQITGASAVALLNKVGLPAKVLTPAGQAIQSATGNKQLSKTGDSVIDTMLQGMGYTV